MNTNKKTPKLRFKGFADDWKQRKFSDLYEKISEKNDLSYSLNKIISVANMYYKSDAKVSNEEYLKTYNIFRYGEIAFEGNKSKDFAYGRFVENTIGDGIISHVFEVFRPIIKYDIYFWKYYINYEPIMGKVLSRCTKKTTMMTNLVAKDFLKETVLVPTLAEQKQIGTLLNTLDKFITLHQRKLEKLKLTKKALLQKLFPKNGSQFPEIRFKGFTDAWEQRKLGTILSRRKENRLIDSAYPRLAFAAGQGVIPLSERRTNNRDQLISDEKNKKYLVTYYNDIVYNPANVKYGAIDRNKYGQGVISPIYVTFTSNVCSGFIEHIVKSNDFKQKALSFEEGTVTKRQAVNPDNLLNIDVNITLNIKEQKKLSNLFEMLDQYITLHQRKLERLQEVKKGLLQKMFV